MTTAASTPWTPAAGSTSIDGDFYSGEVASTDTYVAYNFGFAAREIIIRNKHASNRLAIQWPRQAGLATDSGIVEGNGELRFQNANKTGIQVRSETGGAPATYYVMAVR